MPERSPVESMDCYNSPSPATSDLTRHEVGEEEKRTGRWAPMLVAVVCVATQLTPNAAEARTEDAIDAAVAGAVLVGVGLLQLMPTRTATTAGWESTLLGFDEGAKQNFSATAARYSDVFELSALLLPVAYQAGRGVDEAFGRSLLIYGEALGISLFLNTLTKHLVGRPRPFVYSDRPEVIAYAQAEGPDGYKSFYSGHTAMAFTAATAGPYLFALRSDDIGARASLWGVEAFLASATSLLRVRAGKHFYTDILVGALAGMAVGAVVPLVHPGGRDYDVHLAEGLSYLGGLVAGTCFGLFMPMPEDIPVMLAPMGSDKQAGVVIVGRF